MVVALGGCATTDQSASPVTSLETQLERKRFVVLPRPPAQAVEDDVAAVVTELEAARRRGTLIDQALEPPARPDLDDAVASGIQSRNLERALGR
jgi:hypothetical protein